MRRGPDISFVRLGLITRCFTVHVLGYLERPLKIKKLSAEESKSDPEWFNHMYQMNELELTNTEEEMSIILNIHFLSIFTGQELDNLPEARDKKKTVKKNQLQSIKKEKGFLDKQISLTQTSPKP